MTDEKVFGGSGARRGFVEKAVLAKLRDAVEQSAMWIEERDSRVVEAREAGCTWEQIADASGMSRMGVIKIYQRASGK